MKILQKSLLLVCMLQFVAASQASQEGYYSYDRMKIGEGPWMSIEYFDQYIQFNRLLDIVKQAQKVIKAKDTAERDIAKKELVELMTREIEASGKHVDPLVKKVIRDDIKIIQESTNKAALDKAYGHLCDIVLGIDAQKDIVVVESRPTRQFRRAKEAITGSIRSGVGKVTDFFGAGSAQKPEIAKPEEEKAPWAVQKRQIFDLSTIVQQAERVVKAESDDERKQARLALTTLLHNDRLHPAVKRVLAEDAAILMGSSDVQSMSKAYDRLRDMIELIHSLKFMAIDIEPEWNEIIDTKIKAIVPQKIQDMAGKIAARMPDMPTVEVPFWWPKLGYLKDGVDLADRVIAAQDVETRKMIQEELKKLVDKYSNPQIVLDLDLMGIKKITDDELKIIIKSTDQQTLEKSRDYLKDILAAMNSQKDAFEKLGSHIFHLPKIVEKAAAVVKAQDDQSRDVARKAFSELIADKNLDSKVKKLIKNDIDIIQESDEKDALNKAYEHLGYVIDAIDMAKTNLHEVIGYGEHAYRKVKGLVKKVVPESVQNLVDKSVEYLVGKHPFAKSDFYKNLMLFAAAYAAGSGIRAMLNKYKILAYMPELEKNIEKSAELREKRLERAVEVYAEGGTPGQDKTIKDINAAIEKLFDEGVSLENAVLKAGVPVSIWNAYVDKYEDTLQPMYEPLYESVPAEEAPAK